LLNCVTQASPQQLPKEQPDRAGVRPLAQAELASLVLLPGNGISFAVEDADSYLARTGLTRYVHHIEARDPSDPGLMKPHPYLIEQAAQALRTTPVRCTLIGDQTTDIRATKAIGASSIGYANKPGKADGLTAAGADAIIAHISELTEVVRAS
jgi:phosphoglycolate phosphatase